MAAIVCPFNFFFVTFFDRSDDRSPEPGCPLVIVLGECRVARVAEEAEREWKGNIFTKRLPLPLSILCRVLRLIILTSHIKQWNLLHDSQDLNLI
jgi:hypothetical protein